MKRAFLTVLFACCCLGLSAQARNTKSKSQTGKSKAKTSKTTASKNSEPATVRDRINQRLKDSAAVASKADVTTTVINGITVTNAASAAATKSTSTTSSTSAANVNSTEASVGTNLSTTTIGGNSVTNSSSIQGRPIPGTIPVSPTNGANVEGKPITQEQTRSTATDVNRVQMNAINGNQVASAAQNPANTTKNMNGMTGESQWGTNQIGENMWTPPNNIIEGFTRDFPAIRGATWTRDNALNTFSARYKTGDMWTTSTYNNNGVQMETRTEMPLLGTLPVPLNTFKSKQSALVDFTRISRVVRAGREELFEVRLSTGRIAYINSRGEEVSFQ